MEGQEALVVVSGWLFGGVVGRVGNGEGGSEGGSRASQDCRNRGSTRSVNSEEQRPQ